MDTINHAVAGILILGLMLSSNAEVLHNADLELTTYTNWFCAGGCTLTPSPTAHEGTHSVLVSNRNKKWKGAAQLVDLNAGSRYEISGYVQFVSTKDSQPLQDMVIMLTCKNYGGEQEYYVVSKTSVGLGQWALVGGVVLVPVGSTECKIYFQTDAPSDYLLDTTSLKSKELLKNNEFESTTYNNWFAMGQATLTSSLDAYRGQYSVLVSNRNNRWDGAAQFVNLEAGSRYRMTGYVKFLTTLNNKPYQDIGLKLTCKDASGSPKWYNMGSTPRAELGRWYQVGGILKVPEGSTDCKVYFQTDAPANYLLDTTSLEKVTLDEDWKQQAEDTIEEIRKASTEIRLTGSGLDQSTLEYEIVQTSSEFIWGSAVGASQIVDPSYSKYQQVFNENFEWATLENALKWKQMEKQQGQIDYETSLNAIQALNDNGKKVRGHCVFWAVQNKVQEWVNSLSGQALTDAVSTRIQGLIGQTKGKLEHWDVNNENQHGDFYEQKTGNANITMEMFQQIRSIDGNVKLFLNDFGMINSASVAVATKDQAERYIDEGVPLYGIGVQGHLGDFDIGLFKARLDLLAETGLPILITELGVNDVDEAIRASKLSDLLYLFFSHPSVEGVMFWGFWDGKIAEEEAPLFNGDDVIPNAAGLMYQELRRQWTSQVSGSLSGSDPITFRGFKGSYSLTVKQYGEIVATETFDLSDNTQTVDLDLDIPVPVVKNDQLESTDYGDNWFCRGGCTLTASTNAHAGEYSVLVTNRAVQWHSLAQNVDFKAGSRYRVTAYVNLVNTKDNKLYQEVGLSAQCKDSEGASQFYSFGKTPRAEPGEWYEIGGAEQIPDGIKDCVLYIVTDLASDYLIDSFTAEELVLASDWKETAAQTIEEIRKADITIRVTGSELSNLEYEVVQTGHEYVWGSAVSATHIIEPEYAKYQEVFYDNFEWGVIGNALKWKPMERTQGDIDYEKGQTAIDALRSHGKKIRGHCTFWAVDKWVQDWVFDLSGQELEDAIATRIDGVINEYKGQLEHWDVNNENQHGDFFERMTGKTNITWDMFEQINEIDSDVRLYLNDYAIISSSSSVVANKDQAVRMVENEIPISGIGVQGHLHVYDLILIKARLDILAEAGLPILITELGVNDDTDEGRADKLSDLMYTFFSHVSVEGLVIWGFWDGRIWEPDAPLFNGPDVTPNAAGNVYLDLRQQWTTNVTGSFGGASSVTVRGFKGDYSLNILQNGNVVTTQVFSLTDGGATVDIQL